MTPDLLETLELLIRSYTDQIRVSLPGEIVSYSGGFADIQPALQIPQESEDGGVTFRPLPILPKVKVLFPGGGGVRMSWIPQKGDAVILIVQDSDPNLWISKGGKQSSWDPRMHHISNCVAIPISRTDSEDGGDFSMSGGSFALGGTSPLAISSKVLTELTKIKTAATASADGDSFRAAVAALSFSDPKATKVKGA